MSTLTLILLDYMVDTAACWTHFFYPQVEVLRFRLVPRPAPSICHLQYGLSLKTRLRP